jgi:phosphate-selective porin OprO/OprP
MITRFGAIALLGLTAPTALADDWTFETSPGPVWRSTTTDSYFKLRGRAYFDIADMDWVSPLSGAPDDGEEWRTARLGIEGVFGPVKYVAEFDFSGDDVDPKDVHLTFSMPDGNLRFGNFKTMNSLDEQTSSRYVTFMERGMATDLFGLDRRMGVAYYWNNDDFAASAGFYGGPMDDNFAFSEANDSSAVAGRLTWHSEDEDGTLIHLGGSFRRMNYDGGTRLRIRPHAHLSNRFAAADYRAGSAAGEADHSDLFGLEAAVIRGPFHLHGEFMNMSIDGPAGNPSFGSGFVNAGYFLTGETRAYKSSSGSFARTSPETPVSAGGAGAWEIAARFDTVDMGDAGLGDITTVSLGVNWYVEKHLRVMANVIDGEHDGPGYVEEGDAIQFRVQVDF